MGFWSDVLKAGVNAALGQVPGGGILKVGLAYLTAEDDPVGKPAPDDRPRITLDTFAGPPAYWVRLGPFNDFLLGTGYRTPVSHPTVVVFEWAMAGFRAYLEQELQGAGFGDGKAAADAIVKAGSYDGLGNWHVTLGADIGAGELLEVSRPQWWKPLDPRGSHARRALGRLTDGRVALYMSLQRGYGFDLVEIDEATVAAHADVLGSTPGPRLALPLTNEAAALIAKAKSAKVWSAPAEFGWPAEMVGAAAASSAFYLDGLVVLELGGLQWLVDRTPPAFVPLDVAAPRRTPVLRRWTLDETQLATLPIWTAKIPSTWRRPVEFVDANLADQVDALLPWHWSPQALANWDTLSGAVPDWGRMGVSPSTMLTGPTFWGDRSLWARTLDAATAAKKYRSRAVWVALLRTQLALYRVWPARFEQEPVYSAWMNGLDLAGADTIKKLKLLDDVPRPLLTGQLGAFFGGASWQPSMAAEAGRRHVALARWALDGAPFPDADWDYPAHATKQQALVDAAAGTVGQALFALGPVEKQQVLHVVDLAKAGDPGPIGPAIGTADLKAIREAQAHALEEAAQKRATLPSWAPWLIGAGVAGGLFWAFKRRRK